MKVGKIDQMIVHWVGNKGREEGVDFSHKNLNFGSIEKDLITLITKSFSTEDLYQFFFESTLELNPIFTFVRTIFNENIRFAEQSNFIAKILYEKSVLSHIKGGELSIIYLKDCVCDNITVDAIALLKTETKQKLIQFKNLGEGFQIEETSGISLDKVDKGCVIFNLEEKDGYRVSIVNRSPKGDGYRYWKDDFLHVRSCMGAYHQTQNILNLCKQFVKTEMKEEERTTRAEVINKSRQTLLDNNEIQIEDFVNNVFKDKKLSEKFIEYTQTSDCADEIMKNKLFINKKIVKLKKSFPSTTIHLDSNFEVNIFGGEEFIEKAYDDEAGMNYYKLYFNKEK